MLLEWGDIENQLDALGYDINAIKDELLKGQDTQNNLAGIRQKQVAGGINSQPHVPIEGIGECFMRVDADAYFYWVNRLGHDCWNDKNFRREFYRDNESVRVNTQPKSTKIIVP